MLFHSFETLTDRHLMGLELLTEAHKPTPSVQPSMHQSCSASHYFRIKNKIMYKEFDESFIRKPAFQNKWKLC